ncbi:hypothetical protein [Streptomyces sp. NPDC093795]
MWRCTSLLASCAGGEARRRVLARHVLSPATGDPELPWDNFGLPVRR